MSRNPELTLENEAYPTEDLFYGTRFPQETYLALKFLKLYLMGNIILIHHHSL